jgi:hypothetical protein
MLHRFLSFLIALIVLLTSQQLAVARHQPNVVGTAVLCVGGGFVTVSVDESGAPVGPAHVCPDGIAAFAASFAGNPEPLSRPAGTSLIIGIVTDRSAFRPWRAEPAQARGPPVLI